MRALVLLLLVVSANLASASMIAKDCPSQYAKGKTMWAARDFYTAYGCQITVSPIDKPGMIYREYYFDERGEFVIADSAGEGDFEDMTTLTSYFVYPRTNIPSVSVDEAGDIVVTQANGRSVKITDDVEDNVLKSADLYVEAGKKLGIRSYKDPNGSSVIKDKYGFECKIPNEGFFIYGYGQRNYGEPILKYTDQTLGSYLRDYCRGH